jgi:hypothetical protein
MEKIDILLAPIGGLQADTLDDIEVTLDLGDLPIVEQTGESFDDLIARQARDPGNLLPLRKCRHVLRVGGTLRLTNTYAGPSDPRYLERQEILLNAAGFVDLNVSAGKPLVVEARKRVPVLEEHEFGMVIRELVTPDEIAKSHEFARQYYFFKDFNYDLEVTRQFDLHTDTIACCDKNGEIVALARIGLRVPGYNCPFMYAVTEDGSHYRVPARFRRIGEVMAIYKEGRSGVVGYKRLMEYITQYAPQIAHADGIWTTNDVNDPYTGNYYKTKFKMEEMGPRLTYRDFGGKWNLLCTDKIQELEQIHEGLFRQ